MIIYFNCSVCGEGVTECRELRKGESVLFTGNDNICEGCRHSELDSESSSNGEILKQVQDNDDWMNYYSNDAMEY